MKPDNRYTDALKIAKERFKEVVEKHRRNKGTTYPRFRDYVPPYSVDSFNEKWRKLVPSQPSWTITAHLSKDTYSHIHFDSKQARALTIREAARIQSFPDAFRLAGNTGDAFRQIGNAVPPLMAEAIGEKVKAILAKIESLPDATAMRIAG
jgi:DNA (cytosine-5)-methyltransferase 1